MDSASSDDEEDQPYTLPPVLYSDSGNVYELDRAVEAGGGLGVVNDVSRQGSGISNLSGVGTPRVHSTGSVHSVTLFADGLEAAEAAASGKGGRGGKGGGEGAGGEGDVSLFTSGVLDVVSLAERCGGDLELMESVLTSFVDQGEARMLSMREAVAQKNTAQLFFDADFLGGAAKNICAEELNAAVEDLMTVMERHRAES